jgi:methionyl aminopeptidase
MSTRAALTPGRISGRLDVPSVIARPFYVDARGASIAGPADDLSEPAVKDAETIEAMRDAGRVAAQAILAVAQHIAPGVTTDYLDRIGHEFLLDHGAYPSTLGYKGYPKSLCTSLNEVICHGIPDSTVLEDGDVVKIDITAYKGGVHGDNCATYFAGTPSEPVRLLSERTHEAMMRAIKAVAPGRPLNVVGRVIESYAKRFGYGVVRDYTGHGIGHSFHIRPTVLHFDDPRDTTILEPGMTFTIEPMLALGDQAWTMWDDGWTVLTRDRSWVAQWEHTLVVTDDGARILTDPAV